MGIAVSQLPHDIPFIANTAIASRSSRQERGQVFMTCTEDDWTRGTGQELQRWEVKAGTLRRMSADCA